MLKQMTHLPIIVDPAHGTGKVDLVTPMAKAAIAAGMHTMRMDAWIKALDGRTSVDEVYRNTSDQ